MADYLKSLILAILFTICFCFGLAGQVPTAGSGNTLEVRTIENTIAVGANWALQSYPITVTAWIYADPTSFTSKMPIVYSKDDPGSNRGFQFQLRKINSNWFLDFSVGDGSSLTQNSLNSVIAPFSKIREWTHVAAVATAPQTVDIYINGLLVTTTSDGNIGTGYVATGFGLPRIGGSMQPGMVIFPGFIDEVTIFNSARTVAQIREFVCKQLPVGAPNLVAYYKMNELTGATFIDSRSGNAAGTATIPLRSVSGAAIGDHSNFLLGPFSPADFLQLITVYDDTITFDNYVGGAQIIYLYSVNSLPNHLNGLPQTTCILERYFGVFTTQSANAPNPTINSYRIRYSNPNYFGQDNFRRLGNDDPLWATITIQPQPNGFNFITNHNREFILAKNLNWQSNLPDTIISCTSPVTLTTDSVPGTPMLWSTGDNTSSISVAQSGLYWVEIGDSCGSFSDSVHVFILSGLANATQDFLDSQVRNANCQYPLTLVAPALPFVQHQWPDASNSPTYIANAGDQIFITLFSDCDTATSDTILLPQATNWQPIIQLPDPICTFPIDVFAQRHPYATMTWSTSDTGTTTRIFESQLLRLEVVDSCGIQFDEQMIELSPPSDCAGLATTLYIPSAFTPNGDDTNDIFLVSGTRLTEFQITIFDRWGQRLFFSDDIQKGWDGTMPNGNLAQTGVYTFVITYRDYINKYQVREGVVTLF
ncbi:MAG: gliding motility-associated C-terminal domain-containing protein [Schleiferiaceae bacterium]|nr:gliding motility-associated C-terminal domain-containing protein [Schleiferiaceae bacterium]